MAEEKYWHCNVCDREQPVSAGNICKGCGNDLLLYGYIYSDADAAAIAKNAAQNVAAGGQSSQPQQPQQQYTPPQQQYTPPQPQQPQQQYTPPQQQQQPQQQQPYTPPQQPYTPPQMPPQRPYTVPQQPYVPQAPKQTKKFPVMIVIVIVAVVVLAAIIGSVIFAFGMIGDSGEGGGGEKETEREAAKNNPFVADPDNGSGGSGDFSVTGLDIYIDDALYSYYYEGDEDNVAVLIAGKSYDCEVRVSYDGKYDKNAKGTLKSSDKDYMTVSGNKIKAISGTYEPIEIVAEIDGVSETLEVIILEVGKSAPSDFEICFSSGPVERNDGIDEYEATLWVSDDSLGYVVGGIVARGVDFDSDEWHDGLNDVYLEISRSELVNDVVAVIFAFEDGDGDGAMSSFADLRAYRILRLSDFKS